MKFPGIAMNFGQRLSTPSEIFVYLLKKSKTLRFPKIFGSSACKIGIKMTRLFENYSMFLPKSFFLIFFFLNFQGSAFRCLKTGEPVDVVLEIAARESGVPICDILENLPAELSVWVDPGEVSYRIGEKGTVKVNWFLVFTWYFISYNVFVSRSYTRSKDTSRWTTATLIVRWLQHSTPKLSASARLKSSARHSMDSLWAPKVRRMICRPHRLQAPC